MKHVYRILQILNRWKGYYLFAGVLLSLHSIIRMLEPKVLQIAIDGVVVFFLTGNSPNMEEADAFAAFFYKVLPEITLDNLSGALFWTGMLLVVVAVLQLRHDSFRVCCLLSAQKMPSNVYGIDCFSTFRRCLWRTLKKCPQVN